MDSGHTEGRDWRDYLAMLRRQRGIMLAAIATVVIVAVALTFLQAPTYEASVKIAVEPPSEGPDLERILFGATGLGTQQEILTSTALVRGVLESHGLPADESDIDAFLEDGVDVEVLSGTTVLQVTVSAPQAHLAARLAQGMAESYLGFLQRDAEERTLEAMADLDTAEETTRRELRSVEEQLADGAGSTQESLEERRDALYARLRWISTRRAELETANAFMRRGDIIQPAIVPDEPTSPRPVRTTALALVLGATLGVGVAFFRDLTDDTVRDEASLVSAGAGPLLGVVQQTRVEPDSGLISSPMDTASDGYRRLRRNVLTAAVTQASTGLRLALVPAGREGDMAAVAVNLAISLVRSGRRVALVDADLERGSAGSLLGVNGKGVSEFLAKNVGMESAVHEPMPGLRFVPTGHASADTKECLASAALGRLFDELSRDVDDVLVVTPPVGAGADALDVAAVVGAVLMSVAPLTTTKTEVRDAATELEQVRATVIGVVLTGAADAERASADGGRDGGGPRHIATSGNVIRNDGSVARVR